MVWHEAAGMTGSAEVIAVDHEQLECTMAMTNPPSHCSYSHVCFEELANNFPYFPKRLTAADDGITNVICSTGTLGRIPETNQ